MWLAFGVLFESIETSSNESLRMSRMAETSFAKCKESFPQMQMSLNSAVTRFKKVRDYSLFCLKVVNLFVLALPFNFLVTIFLKITWSILFTAARPQVLYKIKSTMSKKFSWQLTNTSANLFATFFIENGSRTRSSVSKTATKTYILSCMAKTLGLFL